MNINLPLIGLSIAALLWLISYIIRKRADLQELELIIRNDGGMSKRYKHFMASLTNDNYEIGWQKQSSIYFKFRVKNGSSVYHIMLHEIVGLVYIDYEVQIPMVAPTKGQLKVTLKNPVTILENEQINIAQYVSGSMLKSSLRKFDNMAQKNN